jgi:hypothetical protein
LAIGQSAFVAQAPHTPVAVMQTGLGWEQLVLLTQATHPSEGLHCCVPGHAVLPLKPQMALPAPTPLSLLPLQAIAVTTRAASAAPRRPAPLPLPLVPLVLRMR